MWTSVVVLVAASCAAPKAPQLSAGASSSTTASERGTAASDPAIVWDYEVAVLPSLDLDVRATLHGPIDGDLGVDDAAATYVDHVEVQEGSAWSQASLHDARWKRLCVKSCRLRYHVRLREAAKAVADPDVAIDGGGAVFAPPPTWLVRPAEASRGRYRFHVTTPPGVRFATGVRASSAGKDTYEADTSSIEEAAFAAFGPLRTGHVADPSIEHAAAPAVALADDVVARWLRAEVDAIGTYFAHVPDGHALILLGRGSSSSTGGKTLGGGGASVLVSVGTDVIAQNVMDDWVVAHELVHVAFPDLGRRYSWFSEGLATYVEPIARERKQLVTREKVWADMLEGMPRGLPGPRDGGLDGVHDWGRVYWGGALYFLVADVRIRERTANAKGLEDGLRAVVATGANVETTWPLSRVLDVADQATGANVLHQLYDEMGKQRGSIDLDAFFARLGVRLEGGVVRFDDKAPLAAIRDAILPK